MLQCQQSMAMSASGTSEQHTQDLLSSYNPFLTRLKSIIVQSKMTTTSLDESLANESMVSGRGIPDSSDFVRATMNQKDVEIFDLVPEKDTSTSQVEGNSFA